MKYEFKIVTNKKTLKQTFYLNGKRVSMHEFDLTEAMCNIFSWKYVETCNKVCKKFIRLIYHYTKE